MLVTSFTDKARWSRDQVVRWDTRRLDAYVAYAATVKEIHAIALRIAAPYRPHSQAWPLDRAQGLDLLAEANAQRTKAWEAMLLLGGEDTVATARAWQEAVWVEQRLCRGNSIDVLEWQSAVEAVDQARDLFHLAARKDLSVLNGSVTQSPFIRARTPRGLSDFGDFMESSDGLNSN